MTNKKQCKKEVISVSKSKKYNISKEFKFIDLFCGIGGFHYALTLNEDNETSNNNKCVLACDINKECRKTYNDNFKLEPKEDVTELKLAEIEDFDILCAGFPCQPFSNGGKKESFKDKRGNLFEEIIRIAKDKKPTFMFLENVKHILKVDKGNVFKTILTKLREIDYLVCCQILSPHQLGIPQQRERVIFICIKKDVYEKTYKTNTTIFTHNDTPTNTETETETEDVEEESETKSETKDKPKEEKFNIKLYNDFNFDLGLDKNIKMKDIFEKQKDIDAKYTINEELKKVLSTWDEMIKEVGVGEKLSPTILCHEFNTKIKNSSNKEEFDDKFKKLPTWKKDYIQKNRPLYENKKYKSLWDKWYKKHSVLLKKKEIYGKLEWQTGPKKANDSIWNYFIQVRQSGIRVKKTNYFPTLVAIVQTPIYGKEKRYITPRECARLQSFPDTFKLHEKDNIAYKQFGNAVNVDVIRKITNLILQNYK